MRRSFKYGIAALVAVSIVPLLAVTRLTQANIVNSIINSTPIGSITPSTGAFTTLQAASMDSTPIGGTTPAASKFTSVTDTGLADGCLTATSGLIGSTACPSLAPFTGTSGYSTIQYSGNTLYLVWGETTNFDTGPTTITFAHAFPHGCLMPPQLTDNSDVSTISRIWESGNCTTTGADVRNNGLGQAHYFAIGY